MPEKTNFSTTVHLTQAEVEAMHRLAKAKGMSGKAFLKQLVHDALQRELDAQ